MNHLVELERRALDLQNSGKPQEAAELFSAIVKERPDWEHGMGFYNLAGCYEDLGRLELAEECYYAALRYQPAYDVFLGGLASFLYLHGKPEKAFNAYLEVLKVCKKNNSENGVERCITGLKELGKKMGWPETVVTEKIESTLL